MTKINLLNKFNGVMIDDNLVIINNLNTYYQKIQFTSKTICILRFEKTIAIFYTKNLKLEENYNFLKNNDSNLKDLVFYENVLCNKYLDININKILLYNFLVELTLDLIPYKNFFLKIH